jgi:hypothetical protein
MTSDTADPTCPSGTEPNPDPTAGIRVAMAGLAYLDACPTASHVVVFDRVHGALTDALTAIDEV